MTVEVRLFQDWFLCPGWLVPGSFSITSISHRGSLTPADTCSRISNTIFFLSQGEEFCVTVADSLAHLHWICSTPPVQAQHQQFRDSQISKHRATVRLGTNNHLHWGKAKISGTYKSDQAPGTIYFCIRNCLPSAATKGTQHEKAELRDPHCY